MSDTKNLEKFPEIKVVSQTTDKLVLEIGPQQFTINLPKEKEDTYLIDLAITLDGFAWLNRINEYIFDKSPSLDDLLTHIVQKYKENSQINKKQSSSDFVIPDLKLNIFDIEEQKYKKKLEDNLKNCKSILSINVENNKNPVIFTGRTPGLVIMNEFFSIRKKYNTDNKIEISLVADNVYHWNVKLKRLRNEKLNKQLDELKKTFNYDYIELEIHFHDKLYPSYPPFIKVVRPRLDNHLMNRITNMKMVRTEYWTPARDMNYVIDKLITCLTEQCVIEVNSELNDIQKYPHGAYHNLEIVLVKLASLCDINDSNDMEPLDKTEYKNLGNKEIQNKQKEKKKTNSKTVWGSGTGYGHDGASKWNIDEYLEMQKEKDRQILSVINTLIDNICACKDSELPIIYRIIKSSYIIPFIKQQISSSNMLEMGNHADLYRLIFTFLQLLVTDQSIYLFGGQDALYDTLKKLYDEAKAAVKLSGNDGGEALNDTDIPMIVSSLFEMINPIYLEYEEARKKAIEKESQDWKDKMQAVKDNKNDENVIYKDKMTELNFDVVPFSDHRYRHKDGTINKLMMKRLAREYASFKNSLPVFFESSVFVRIDSTDNRNIKVLITGPDNTPYDSGCFIFDASSGNDYPSNTPKMIFLNHGGKRFNPNLYDNGKVCLTLLGTWRGHASENWNPLTSTLQQLFVSVQSQILVPEPFYNEPGYETGYNTKEGKETSRQYTNERRMYTLNHAMYDLIVNPKLYPEFTDVIVNHFKLKKKYILQLCDKWDKEPQNNFAAGTSEIIKKLKECLEKLN